MKNKDQVASALMKRFATMESDRRSIDIVLQDISDYIHINRQDFTTESTPGERRDIHIYDTTAIHANQGLAAALHSGLTSTQKRWFDLRPSNLKLQNSDAVKRWIAENLNTLYAIFNSPAINFPQENHQVLLDLVAYGTSCLYIDFLPGKGFRFSARPLSEIYIAENSQGRVDTTIRKFKYTARQAQQEWGEENLSEKILKALENNPDQKFTFIHAVMPREDVLKQFSSDFGIDERFSFVCFYACVDDKKVIDIKGYYENPYIVVRWEKLAGEIYGRGPGWNVLAEVKMVNTMSETFIRASQLSGLPPMLVPDDGVIGLDEVGPQSILVGGISGDGRRLVDYLVSPARHDLTLEVMEQRRDAIRKGYFVDQFERKEGTPVTATEFIQQREDNFRLTGPQLFRLWSEYLVRAIERVLSISMREGLLTEAPEELDGENIEIEYVSPLIKSQRLDELVSLNRAIESVMPLIQSDPTLLDNVDGDKAFRNALEIAGVSIESIRKLENTESGISVEAVRQQRAEAQQQMMAEQQAVQAADSIAKLQGAGVNVVQ